MSITDTDAKVLPKDSLAWAPLTRAALGVAALLVVVAALTVLSWALFKFGGLSTPRARNPFGAGYGGGAPAATGLGSFIVMVQAQFYAALTAAVQDLKVNNTAMTSLASVGFLYGIFHAAGPGHGKGVISAYLVANERTVWRGITLSLAAALLQAVVAISIVAVFAILLRATSATINAVAHGIEMASFAAVAVLGLFLLWSKSGELLHHLASARRNAIAPSESPPDFGGFLAGERDRSMDWRAMVGVVFAAGLRPCSGALILLVFALSQGLFFAGVVGAIAMALGTAITTGTLGALAVFARKLALRLSAGRGFTGVIALSAIELLAAAFILTLGVVLLAGIASGGLLSALD